MIDGVRHDQMEKCGHYQRWQEDIDRVQQVGTRYLRFGPALHRSYLGPDHFDWEHADAVLDTLRSKDIIPIADLCRFGVPDWIGDFQNPDLPHLFARYAKAFAERYPWVQFYTPVSAIYTSALTSAKLGLFNEGLSDDTSFVTALKHLAAASVLAMREILHVRPDAIFIHNERAAYFHADSPEAIAFAETLNAMRFVALDLVFGLRVDSAMYEFLRDNGMSREEYAFFMETRLARHCVMGTDYYPANERRVAEDGSRREAGETLGYGDIAGQYYQRYRLPVMHTETSAPEVDGQDPTFWLWKEWANALRVRNSGIPLVGFTWYPLIDQVAWNESGRWEGSLVHGASNPVGLFDLDRNMRPVGHAYRRLIAGWRDLLPAQSVCLLMPVVLPSEYNLPLSRRRRETIHRYYTQRSSQMPPNPFAR
ncbi:family 1 glycosylhydrolase [Novosphingobium sp. TH158]|uniref:family 1 glycosylhydrolase n=1 Tax=Novosphingobium sp. TH158 TaxID=2067455 RepID=UPI0020B161CD|nr:family 1 glycosylhydrolase [Novosphingobium sp. TH158]